ncbi:MAG: D-glycerate dehydrogenase, partial [Candidatus Sericytochromatia bacterium]
MGLPRILITRRIESGALEAFQAFAEVEVREDVPQDELPGVLSAYDAAVTMLSDRLDAAAFARLAGSRLKIIANHAVGYENIDLAAAEAAGIWISNTPDVLTLTTAELAWAL